LYKSNPRRWTGVETSWIAAGAKNCAVVARPDSVLRIWENRDLTLKGRLASCGAMMGGRLNEANIVKLSRTANRAYESRGTAAAGDDDGPPNMRTNRESLYTHQLMFTDEVARNLAGPDETVEAGFEEKVEVSVSTVFAVE